LLLENFQAAHQFIRLMALDASWKAKNLITLRDLAEAKDKQSHDADIGR
jgi:hypothetical protein